MAVELTSGEFAFGQMQGRLMWEWDKMTGADDHPPGGRWTFRSFAALAGQIIRFGLVGVLASLINIGIYWIGLGWGLHPNLAWTIGFGMAVVLGYPLQSRWSFGGHGAERQLLANGGRYLLASVFGFILNSFWVWSLVEWLRWPSWTPMLPVLSITPLSVFVINRDWVFK